MRARKLLTAALLVCLSAPALGAKMGDPVVDDLPPWANEPDRVKLDIAQRLVFDKKQYEAAIPLIAAMRQEGVRAPVLDLLQGIAMREQRLFEESERLLAMAQKRMSGDPRVYEALCILYADTNRLDLAIDHCEKATKLDNTQASALNNLGFLYLATGRADDALPHFQRAVEQDGTERRYRNNLGLGHVATGDDKAALAAFSSANQPAEALYTMGSAVERYRNAEDALPYYRDVLNYDPSHGKAIQAIDRITNPETADGSGVDSTPPTPAQETEE